MSHTQSMDVPVTTKECKRAYAHTIRRASHTNQSVQRTDCVLTIDSKFHAPMNSRLTTANSPYHARRAVLPGPEADGPLATNNCGMLVMTCVSINGFDSSTSGGKEGERKWTLDRSLTVIL